jgi:hypothetical protein
MKKEFEENVHYYLNEGGKIVFTPLYLAERGYCCGNKCTHCPYEKPVKKGNTLLEEKFLHLKK